MLPSAPAATARSMNPSGSSVKTSTRTVLVPAYGRGVPAVALGLAHENRGALDAQPGDAAKAPQFGRAEGTFVPVDSGRRVLDRQHERDMHVRCHPRPSRLPSARAHDP